MKGDLEGFSYSPDGTKVVYVRAIPKQDKYAYLKEGLDKTTGRVNDDLAYRHWDNWVDAIPQPFVADYKDGKVLEGKNLLEGTEYESPMRPWGGMEQITWSPDSKSIVYTCRKKVGKEYAFSTNSDIYLYNIEKQTTENLSEGMMGYDQNPVFSPNGKLLAWESMERDGYESDKNRIFILNRETGEKTDLTKDWDYTVNSIVWSPNSNSIFFIAHYQGVTPVFNIDLKSNEVKEVVGGIVDYADIVPIDEKTLVATNHSMLYPNEIFIVNNGIATKISTVNDEIFVQLTMPTVEKRLIPTTDGKQMTTWVIYPQNFDKNKKYPAILYCQGGPQQAVSQFWSYRWNFALMAANGYVVIAPNRRGLPGFGTEWNEQISGDYGGQNMKDYLSAVDEMKKEPFIDAEHIGATGASYGGFSVYWLAGNHDNRFAALFAHAGIFNTEAQYLETEEMWFANWDLGGPFWDKTNEVAQRTFSQSPHKYVDKWTAPIMISHGEYDFRILASQGMQAFNAAKLRGIPTEMVIYPDENHWVLKPQNGVLWQRTFFAWLDKWLKK